MYAHTTHKQQKTNRYEAKVIQVTVETFQKEANELPHNETDKTGTEHRLQIVLEPSFALRYINSVKYLSGPSFLVTERLE